MADFNEIYQRLAVAEGDIARFTEEIEAWIWDNFVVDVNEVKPGQWEIWASIRQHVPIEFAIRFGTQINELRSILDSIACTLAIKNSGSAKETYFPISINKGGFETNGHKQIKRLSDDDKRRISELKPYKGGNDGLFSLHKLDIIRKHRRLHIMASAVTPLFGKTGVTAIGSLSIKNNKLDMTHRLIAELRVFGEFQVRRRVAIDEIDVPSYGNGIAKFCKEMHRHVTQIAQALDS